MAKNEKQGSVMLLAIICLMVVSVSCISILIMQKNFYVDETMLINDLQNKRITEEILYEKFIMANADYETLIGEFLYYDSNYYLVYVKDNYVFIRKDNENA